MTGSPEGLGPIFFALADPLRRRVLEAAIAHDGATVTQLCELFPVSRFAIMRHLNTLEATGLIRREVHGRERQVYSTGVKFEDAIAAWARTMRERSPSND
jgi:DNA-binding transcriptional ArsR family regulator